MVWVIFKRRSFGIFARSSRYKTFHAREFLKIRRKKSEDRKTGCFCWLSLAPSAILRLNTVFVINDYNGMIFMKTHMNIEQNKIISTDAVLSLYSKVANFMEGCPY